MKGKCTADGVLTIWHNDTTVSIGVNKRQKWDFEICSNGKVRLEYKNIGIFLPREEFDADWEIVEQEG